MKKFITSLLIILSTISTLSAQTDTAASAESAEQTTCHSFPQTIYPQLFDSYDFSICYAGINSAHNLRGISIAEFTETIKHIEISPAGYALALVTADKKGSNVLYVYDLLVRNNRLFRSGRDMKDISTFCYSKDANNIYVAASNGMISRLSTKTYQVDEQFASTTLNPSQMTASTGGYFLAVVSDDRTIVNVVNLQTKAIRKEYSFSNKVSGIDFSADGSQFAISTDDGVINIYDTRTFLHTKVIVDAGQARSCRFHPDGKYIASIKSDNQIEIINLMDDTDRSQYTTNSAEVSKINFFKHYDDNSFLIYNDGESMVIRETGNLQPFYTQLLSSELNERMDTWLKMMDGESLADYNERVTDESRMEQMMLFEQEISTTLAGDLIERSEVKAGDYNLESNMLALDFNTMPSIYLQVPSEEAGDFMDTNVLEFRNAKYAITNDDQFELIYAEVINTNSGKSYTFDNLERRSLEYLKSDDDFVSLELVKQTNMDIIKLEEIKEEIIAEAKKESVISDHTNITVDANVISDTDADGNSIINYNINFSYQVEPKFSAVEDFKPGLYRTEQSGAASSMLKVVEQALAGDFAQYVAQDKRLKIIVSGDADASPIVRKMGYSGVYGDLNNIPVYNNGRLASITVTRESGITTNEQLALLRAWGVKEVLLNNTPQIADMDIDIEYHIAVQKGKGGEFRRIKVELIFVDAL